MAKQERYYGETLGIEAPSDEVALLIPNDDEALPHGKPNYIYVGTGGTAKMRFKNGAVITIPLMQGYHKFRPEQIYATGTSAQSIVGLYDGLPFEEPAPPAPPGEWQEVTLTAGDLGGPLAGWASTIFTEAPDIGSISGEPIPDCRLLICYDGGLGEGFQVTVEGNVVDELNARVMTINGVPATRMTDATLDGSGFHTLASFNSEEVERFVAGQSYQIAFVPE